MKKLVVGLLGATAIATTLILVRQREPGELKEPRALPGEGETPQHLSLERLRAVGF